MKNKIIFILLIGFIACCRSVYAQDGSGEMVLGRVSSPTEGELMAVTVTEVDNNDRFVGGTSTDINGEFSLKIKSSKNRLRFSYVGFVTKILPIGPKRNFVVVMEESNVLQEVVIKASATVSDGGMNVPLREVSYAMQKIDTKEFEGIQVASIEDALQGRIAGLDIVGSGEVGKGMSMRIRGASSINGNTQPLVVLNDIPFEVTISPSFDFATATEEQFADLLNINPDDIQEIMVLKDAASTAIWGSKGANGVLRITTKKGVKGPTRVTYTYKFSGSQQPKGMKMLNGDDYTMLMKQAYFNPSQDNQASNVREFNYLSKEEFSEAYMYDDNTDWRGEVIQFGHTNDHYLTISGGGDKAKFRVTAGYMDQVGSIIGQGMNRVTSRMDLDYNVSSRIRFTSEIAFTRSDFQYNWSDTRNDNNKRSILDIAYKKMPNLAIYNQVENGVNTDVYYNIQKSAGINNAQKELRNPVALANLATNDKISYRVQPVLRLQYDLLDPEKTILRYNGYVSVDMRNDKTRKFLPKEVTADSWDSPDVNRRDDYDSESMGVQSENKMTWQPQFANKDHSMILVGQIQTSSGSSNDQSMVSYVLPFDVDPSASNYMFEGSSGIGQWRNMGLIGRLHYSFQSKYVADFTIRRDGSTKFGENNKFGNFPGVSLRWNISDEKFMNFSDNWLDMLSFRPSWGISGNEPGAEYLHFSRYAPWSSYAGAQTITPQNIKLSDLRWETVTEVNLGADIAVLDYKYTFDFNVYRRETNDMLFKDTGIPSSTGYSKITYKNGGKMKNEGWEVNFHANKFVSIGQVTVDASFNMANSINTLLELDDDILASKNSPFDYKNGNYLSRIQEGNSYGSIYGFRYKGVYQYSAANYEKGTAPVVRDGNDEVVMNEDGTPKPMMYNFATNGANYIFQAGDAMYQDINHDGNIDELDIVYLGNSNPLLNGGFGTTFRWKQLSCNLFFNFRYGNKIVNKARMYAENMYGDDNQSVATNWRWRKEGDVTEMPRALYNYGYNWLASDRYVEDGSFLRFKYLTFNYAVPPAFLKQYSLKTLSFYLTFNNLLTFTKYTGVDPEVGYGSMGVSEDKSTTPRSLDFTLGVSVGF